jgi:hypothetical protein
MLYVFFWVIARRLNFVCRRFGTLCMFHLCRHLPAYEDGADRVFPNVGIQNSDAGQLPRRKHTTMCIKLENEPTFKRMNRANNFKCHIIVINCQTYAKTIRPTSVCFLPIDIIFPLYNYRVVCGSPETSPLEFLSEEMSAYLLNLSL